MDDISNYNKIREDALNFYKKIGKISCPAFKDEFVYFNSEGFNHLVYKNKRRGRKKEVQIMKFRLLPKARKLVAISSTYQEQDESLMSI